MADDYDPLAGPPPDLPEFDSTPDESTPAARSTPASTPAGDAASPPTSGGEPAPDETHDPALRRYAEAETPPEGVEVGDADAAYAGSAHDVSAHDASAHDASAYASPPYAGPAYDADYDPGAQTAVLTDTQPRPPFDAPDPLSPAFEARGGIRWTGRLRQWFTGWRRWITIPLVTALLAGCLFVLLLMSFYSGTGDSGPRVITETPLLAQVAEWPLDVEYAPQTVPARIRHDLPAPGARHGYVFRGEAGQTWLVVVEPLDDDFDPLITLYAPTGEVLRQNDDRAPGDLAAEVLILLPVSGDYHLLVESAAGGTTSGLYLLTLDFVR